MELNDIKIRWHFIDGYEDYLVTEYGDIYSYRPDKNEKRGFKGLRKLKPKGINNPNRYLTVVLSKNNKQKTIQIHRLVGKYFVEGFFENAVIDHKDRNKHNNCWSNLEWVTQRENIKRSYQIMNQVRNYKNWIIKSPDGNISGILKGFSKIKEYIETNNIPIKISMLTKHKNYNGYELIEV